MTYKSTWTPIADVVSAAREVIARWESGDLAGAVRRMSAALEELDASVATPEQVKEAMRVYESDEVSVDRPALVSPTDDGYWVSASLFVPQPDADEDEV